MIKMVKRKSDGILGFFVSGDYVQWADDPTHLDYMPEREDYIILRNRKVADDIEKDKYYMMVPKRLVPRNLNYVEEMQYLRFRCIAANTNGTQHIPKDDQGTTQRWHIDATMVVEITYGEYVLNKDLWRDTRGPKPKKSGVKVLAFPHCCTAGILCNFGESIVAAGGGRKIGEEALERDILHQIKLYKDNGYAFLSATTNNEQKTANRVLTRLGFSSSKWMSKKTHEETEVRLWWIHLDSVLTRF